MSVVVAAVGDGFTAIAADSACETADQRFLVKDKVWQLRPWLAVGAVGDAGVMARLRIATLKSSRFQVITPLEDAAVWTWRELSQTFREMAEIPDYDSPAREAYGGLGVIVCVGSSIVLMGEDMTPMEDSRGFVAIGSGAAYALGYLESQAPFSGLDETNLSAHLRRAVEITANHCPGVAGPVHNFVVRHG